MRLYREEGVNPFGQIMGCLPMLLQMPIWIALYSSLRNNVSMRGRGFFWWIDDLTAPDTLVSFDPPFNLVFTQLEAFHLLPILVGVMMFAQQKLMPKPKKPAGASDSPQAQQAEQMQKMMPYMSLVMIFLFYGFPSGLNLYIMTSSLFGTAEQLYIRKHLSKTDLSPPVKKVKPQPRSGPTFLEKIQKRAEEAQKTQSRRKKKT
jgi:YidC/Oxa1 family membrane protein insertase